MAGVADVFGRANGLLGAAPLDRGALAGRIEGQPDCVSGEGCRHAQRLRRVVAGLQVSGRDRRLVSRAVRPSPLAWRCEGPRSAITRCARMTERGGRLLTVLRCGHCLSKINSNRLLRGAMGLGSTGRRAP